MSSKNSRYLSTYKTATKFIIQMKDEVESQYKQYQLQLKQTKNGLRELTRKYVNRVKACVAFHRSLHTGESIDQSHNRIDQQVWIRKRISRLERGMTSIQEQMSMVEWSPNTTQAQRLAVKNLLQINYTITCHPNNNLTVLTTSIFHVTNRDISDSAQTIEDAVL
ncbi:10578_t:CDS:2 [Rhizophagus irregularis]|nr:10578_t:CDS:2 [Rhizophagus irregularis]